MPLMLPVQDLLEPVDDASGVELPRHFADSPEHPCAAISRCDQADVPSDTLIAALMTELKTPTFGLRSDLDCRAVQRNPFSRLSRQSKVPKRTSGLSLAV